MSSRRILLDTNAIVALLQGNSRVLQLTQDADWVGVSIISHLEFLCFAGLSADDIRCFEEFLRKVDLIGLEPHQQELLRLVIQLRQASRLKLPDAIIAATAITHHAHLVSADAQLRGIPQLQLISF